MGRPFGPAENRIVAPPGPVVNPPRPIAYNLSLVQVGNRHITKPRRLFKDLAVQMAGGTITHHHAATRHHMPWCRAHRPDFFGRAFVAAKSALDPVGITNPGAPAPRASGRQQ